jgi:phosphoserine phosphatase/predicted acylesterase/phospholipase RssA
MRLRLFPALLLPILCAVVIAEDRPQAPAPDPTGTTRVIKVGYTAFENPRVVSSDSGLHSTIRYLQHVSEQSRNPPWRTPIGFDVSVGNYYQIWSWFRRKQIDAALVSPFIAYLLEREGDALSVLEFKEHCEPSGHQPLIAAAGLWRNAPAAGFDWYLSELYDIAKASLPAAEERRLVEKLGQRFRLNFVAHLSSSGFVMPALYAHRWLQTHADRPPGSPEVDLDAPEIRTFWRLFIENARFTLNHGVQSPQDGVSDLYFSYSGRPTERLASDRSRGQFVKWQGYHLDPDVHPPRDGECEKDHHEAPEIPNDVLVVRRSLITELLGAGRIDRALLGDQLLQDPARGDAASALFASDAGYTGVSWFSSSAHELFRERVQSLFDSNAELRRTAVRWFERGWFDFTIDETIGLLRQDQLNSRTSNLALVLSGGGVKSLYQTQILSHLYGEDHSVPMLSNYNADAVVSVPIVDEIPLSVRNVIGTSGGAMLAYFAAQLPIQGASTKSLVDLLKDTSSRTLFPPADIPRVLSVVVLLALLFAALNVARMISRDTLRQAARQAVRKGPWMVLAIQGLFVLAGALVIVGARHPNQETARGIEGALYAFLVGLAHMSVSCISRSRAQERAISDPDLRKAIYAGYGLGFMMTLAGLAIFFLTLANDPMRDTSVASVPPLLAIGGLCVISLALISYAGTGLGRLRLEWEAAVGYFRALSIALLVVVSSYVVVLIASWSGAISTLELTGPFWKWLIGAGLVTSTTVILIGLYNRSAVGEYLLAGTVELMRDRHGTTTTTLAGSLTSIATIGLACWTIIVAPAIYGNEYARRALREALPAETLDLGVFRSNLVVTGALLADSPCAPAGGLYFCFGGQGGCGAASHRAWQALQAPPPRRALDAVFASGSPFPVFSPHSTALPNGCPVPLVDGGYAHNVPLEAASLTDARQVVVINASPDPREDETPHVDDNRLGVFSISRWSGQLVRSGSRILDFMFARAQELDSIKASGLLVATLTPRPADGIWPFLLDFTPATRKRMIDEATNDIEQGRRIGRIESWGFPVFATRINPGDSQLGPRGWSPEIRRLLASITASASKRTVVALDLDNTILHGDIGDAMFLKMVVERQYAGDEDRFWSLIPNERAAQVLRDYWTQFKKNPPKTEDLEPHRWTPEFADYVVLFIRQYEEMLKPDDGGRKAYPWVVSLMSGLGADTLRKMAGDLWKKEMDRSAAPFTIHSRKYGDVEIQGGLRVHQELRQLIDDLHQKGAQVWIVTASSEWLGQHVAGLLKIPRERVLGMRLRTSAFGQLEPPLTYREGKADALRLKGLRPVLAIGDSMTDVEMLKDANSRIIIDRGKIPVGEVEKALWQRFDLLSSQKLP